MKKNEKYWDDYDVYSQEEFDLLKEWIEAHIEPLPIVKPYAEISGYRREPLEMYISGNNIADMASLDIGYIYDYEIVRFAMIELDPFPKKIDKCFFYHAKWKSGVFEDNASEKWRIEP